MMELIRTELGRPGYNIYGTAVEDLAIEARFRDGDTYIEFLTSLDVKFMVSLMTKKIAASTMATDNSKYFRVGVIGSIDGRKATQIRVGESYKTLKELKQEGIELQYDIDSILGIIRDFLRNLKPIAKKHNVTW